eukprot:TRINITY_DN11692_c0_g1_i1.p1 TRINITY_DN11692_c0_g1~~TRINITY_DN11692_c0_g1_i1.p1  ORF type:complete len:915 (-),score=144.95 TRINITY_DN11692_c0_g1_i1:783-3527(-)
MSLDDIGGPVSLWVVHEDLRVQERSPQTPTWLRGPLLGVGSFGSVNMGLDLGTGQLLAVKTVDADGPPENVQALENEYSILSSVNSPRVVRCYGADWTVEEGVRRRNLLLEHMTGGSISDLTVKFGGKLDESLVRRYTKDLLEGLRDLHALGYVHCDIKGRNLLLGKEGVKIGDFGAAEKMPFGVQEAARCQEAGPMDSCMASEVGKGNRTSQETQKFSGEDQERDVAEKPPQPFPRESSFGLANCVSLTDKDDAATCDDQDMGVQEVDMDLGSLDSTLGLNEHQEARCPTPSLSPFSASKMHLSCPVSISSTARLALETSLAPRTPVALQECSVPSSSMAAAASPLSPPLPTQKLRGTICWMAPEVVQTSQQSFAADIWSVGCTVIEMATGRVPWNVKDITPCKVLYKLGFTSELPPFPSRLSSEGTDFLYRCLNRNPSLRPSAAELLNHPFISQAFTRPRPVKVPKHSASISASSVAAAAAAAAARNSLTSSPLPLLPPSPHSKKVLSSLKHHKLTNSGPLLKSPRSVLDRTASPWQSANGEATDVNQTRLKAEDCGDEDEGPERTLHRRTLSVPPMAITTEGDGTSFAFALPSPSFTTGEGFTRASSEAQLPNPRRSSRRHSFERPPLSTRAIESIERLTNPSGCTALLTESHGLKWAPPPSPTAVTEGRSLPSNQPSSWSFLSFNQAPFVQGQWLTVRSGSSSMCSTPSNTTPTDSPRCSSDTKRPAGLSLFSEPRRPRVEPPSPEGSRGLEAGMVDARRLDSKGTDEEDEDAEMDGALDALDRHKRQREEEGEADDDEAAEELGRGATAGCHMGKADAAAAVEADVAAATSATAAVTVSDASEQRKAAGKSGVGEAISAVRGEAGGRKEQRQHAQAPGLQEWIGDPIRTLSNLMGGGERRSEAADRPMR